MLIQELRYIIQSAHINFLYGSGLSLPYLSTLGNIETYLTRLNNDFNHHVISEDQFDIVRSSLYKAYCEEVIIPNFNFPHNDPKFVATSSAYMDFFRIWNDLINKRSTMLLDKQVNMFTTNIDLLVEETLSASELELNDGFRGTLKQTFNESNFQISLSKSSMQFHKAAEIPIFNLMKVHGAVNWEEENGLIHSNIGRIKKVKEQLEAIPATNFVSLNRHDPVTHKDKEKTYDNLVSEASTIAMTDPKVFNNFFKEYDRILMINPTKEKFKTTVMDYHFYELMRILSNSLERENSVLFVMGFSFADEHLAEITIRAASINPTLQVVIFAYGDDDKDKYFNNLKISGHGANNNIDILTPTEFRNSNNEKYNTLCSSISHFDLPTINNVFRTISTDIHSAL